mgnify:CR=1 FL=1
MASSTPRRSSSISFALMAFWAGYRIEHVTTPFGQLHLGLFSLPATVLWIVGIVNAINLIDGLDGLASGISLFTVFVLFILGVTQGNVIVSLTSISLAGALLGFLRYNFNPASIFMGDSGALFLGFALAAVPFFEHAGIVRIEHLLIPFSLLFFPVMDMFLAIVRRIRQRKPLHSPDKEHIHHKLLDLGFTSAEFQLKLAADRVRRKEEGHLVLVIKRSGFFSVLGRAKGNDPVGQLSAAYRHASGWLTAVAGDRIGLVQPGKNLVGNVNAQCHGNNPGSLAAIIAC